MVVTVRHHVRPDAGPLDSGADPIIGTYRVEGSTLRFVARYPLDQPHYRGVYSIHSLLARSRSQRLAGRPLSGQAGSRSDLDLQESTAN